MSFQKPLKLFIAYAHEDEKYKDELVKRLKLLKQQNKIKVWHDGELVPGYKYPEVIDHHLKNADVVLYLVSSDSLASDACNKELANALGDKKRLIPIILRECDWKRYKVSRSSIADFLALPNNGNPIKSWKNKDKAWQNVIDGIRKILDSVKEQEDTPQSILFELGNAKYILGALDEARMAYTKTIELKPDFVAAYNNHKPLFRKLEQYDKAEEDLAKVIELKPDFAVAYASRGVILRQLEQYDKAEEDLAKVIEIKPDFAGTYYIHGDLLRELKEYDKAKEGLTKLIEFEHDYAEVYAGRGILFSESKQYGKTETDYSKAIKLNPNLAVVYANHGINTVRDRHDPPDSPPPGKV